MSVFYIILVIAVVGLLLWVLNTYVPMQSTVRSILNLVVVVLLIVWLLQVFGLISPILNIRMR